LRITARLAGGLEGLGFTFLGPTGGPNASGIVTVSRPGTDMEVLFKRLSAANIVCSSRQDRQGRHYIRFSPHFYNTEAEVDQVLKVIEPEF
jgi:cysteine desulfurase/selenocysteine lyase